MIAPQRSGLLPPNLDRIGLRQTDLRLAGLAVAAWLAALAALHLSPLAAALLAVTATVGAAAVSALLVRDSTVHRRTRDTESFGQSANRGRGLGGRFGWIAVAVLIGAVCGAGATAARLTVRDADQIRGPAERRATVTATLVVRDDPRPIPRAGGRAPAVLVAAELVRLEQADGPAVTTAARVLVLAGDPAWRRLLPGQRLVAMGRLGAPRGGDLTAAVLSAAGPPKLIGRSSWAQRAAGFLRAGLQSACVPLPDDPGGLLPGLVVGDTSQLPASVEEDFRATGMTHLVAVSGSNVAIVVGFVLVLTRWGRLGPVPAAVVCALALAGFVILARPSPSVVRAASMGAIGLVALAAGRPRAAVPALCAAVVTLVVLDPELAGDPGFALSVLATAGLLLLAPGWRDGLRRRGVPPGVAEALAIPAAAQVACAPVVAALSGTVSLVAVPANLLAVPVIAPATVLGVAATVVSPVWPAGAEFGAWLASWPAWWLVVVARTGARLPAGALPWPDGVTGGLLLAALTVALLVGARHPTVRRLVLVVAVAAAVGALPVRLAAGGWPPPGWLIVTCAVGQGDALVLAAGTGRAVVVDAGPDPAAVDGCLRRLGVREVSVLVFSHLHADHTGGVAGVFRARRVGAVVLPAWPEPATGQRAVAAAAAAAATPVRTAATGWTARDGELEIQVLGPPYPIRGTRSDPNNNSLILQVRLRGMVLLLAGDAEGEEQRAVLDRLGPAALRADVLKVPHHGSAYQEPSFLDAVDPRVALVSVGAENRYGHPNPAVLDRLARNGARVLRTDTQGDLAAVEAGNGLAVVVRNTEPGRIDRAASGETEPHKRQVARRPGQPSPIPRCGRSRRVRSTRCTPACERTPKCLRSGQDDYPLPPPSRIESWSRAQGKP